MTVIKKCIFKISGRRDQIFSIIGTEESDFSFKNTVPYPPELVHCTDRKILEKWRSENWGTNLDAYGVKFVSEYEDSPISKYLEHETGDIEISFKTKWCIPYNWFKTTTEKYPDLELDIYWADEDYADSGLIYASNGQITHNEYYEYCTYAHEELVIDHFPDIYDVHKEIFQ